MSAQAQLRLIDVSTGEIVGEGCRDCQAKDDEYSELVRRFRAQSRELAELRRDREAEAKLSQYWPVALRCFIEWQEKCRHPKSAWSIERFYLVLPFLKRGEHGERIVLRAIAGAAYDPFIYKLRNGRSVRSDSWEKIFESVGKFEEFVNKCPLDWSSDESKNIS